jgi:hypothetical protein
MAVVSFTRQVPLSPVVAWTRLTTFTDHGLYVPFTVVRLIDPAAPGGGGFIARTAVPGVSRLGFDDVNVLERWEPPFGDQPGLCQLRKAGGLVRGWARLTVDPIAADAESSIVSWYESIDIRRVPRAAAPVIAAVGTRMFGRVVDGLMATG